MSVTSRTSYALIAVDTIVSLARTRGFAATKCDRNFSCKVGTIFEDSNLSLQKRVIAMYLISSHKKGMSSCQLARDIKVTQKTAWYMLQKIRLLYQQSDADAFNGTVECDEVYIGGTEKWKHKSMHKSMCTPHVQGRSTQTKTPVFGMMERSTLRNKKNEVENITYVHAFVVENTTRATLQPIIQRFVVEGSRVITDELNAYNGLNTLEYAHAVVNHGAAEYADGDVFTNSTEGFWSHFRRMISGCYQDVSDGHLQTTLMRLCTVGTQGKWTNRRDSPICSESPSVLSAGGTRLGLDLKWLLNKHY